MAAAGITARCAAGKTDIAINLNMRGVSPAAWASTARANVRVVAGPATIVNTKTDRDVPLRQF